MQEKHKNTIVLRLKEATVLRSREWNMKNKLQILFQDSFYQVTPSQTLLQKQPTNSSTQIVTEMEFQSGS